MADIREELTELDFTEQIASVPRRIEDEPRVPSNCIACKAPIQRASKFCARCKVAA